MVFPVLLARTGLFLGQKVWRLAVALALLCAGFLASRLARGLVDRWGRKAFAKFGEDAAAKASAALMAPVRFALGTLGVYLAVMTLAVPPAWRTSSPRDSPS